jgi:predicted DNA-binding protein (UPF0251 family)
MPIIVKQEIYMPRPKYCRKIVELPNTNYYKPSGIPSSELLEIVITLDEFEAIRLADFEGLYQENAADKMNVSRQTFGRIIISAHKKIAEALVFGKAIKIEGGNINLKDCRCPRCRKHIEQSINSNCGCPKIDNLNRQKNNKKELITNENSTTN